MRKCQTGRVDDKSSRNAVAHVRSSAHDMEKKFLSRFASYYLVPGLRQAIRLHLRLDSVFCDVACVCVCVCVCVCK